MLAYAYADASDSQIDQEDDLVGAIVFHEIVVRVLMLPIAAAAAAVRLVDALASTRPRVDAFDGSAGRPAEVSQGIGNRLTRT